MLLKLAWRNIGRGWRRSAVVLSAIAVGLAACLVLIAWMKGLMFQMADNAIRTQLAHVAIQAAGYQQSPDLGLNLGDQAHAIQAAVARHEGVHASPRVRGEGLVQNARHSLRVMLVGVNPAAEARVSVVPGSVVEGAFLARMTGPRRLRQLPPLVIGRAMAERLRAGLGDKLVLHVPGEGGVGAFRVRGIYRTSSSEFDRSVAYAALPDALELFGTRGPTEVALALERPRAALELQAALRAELERLAPGRFEVLRWQERAPRLASMLNLASSTSWIFYGVIFVAMAFGIANALLMSIYERMREFGVLRSLGLGARRLVALVLMESLLLTFLGTALGFLVGWPLITWLGRVGIDMTRFSSALESYGIGTTIYLRVDATDLIWPIGLAGATALLAALWPALKAARLRPAEALRGS